MGQKKVRWNQETQPEQQLRHDKARLAHGHHKAAHSNNRICIKLKTDRVPIPFRPQETHRLSDFKQIWNGFEIAN
jgi:hypothetical protein